MTTPPPIATGMRGMARAFFEGAARHELLLPRCRDCDLLSWPPRSGCPKCGSRAIEWIHASGRGAIHTYTVVRQAPDPSFAAQLPYVVAMIDLDEGVRLMSRIVECPLERARIGLRVAVTFVDPGDGRLVPVFRPESS